MNEQSNRHAMIRCVRAKSSMGYPEVFHRFCGYLRGAANFSEIFSGAESRALSRSRRLNFHPPPKKFRSTPPTPVWCAVALSPVARAVQLRNFSEKMPSQGRIS
jgi:hypothetical protein